MKALGRVWAIGRMTMIEASRRKVFSILLLFGVALLSSILFFPSVEPESRLKLIEVWSLRASALFTAIVGLFLAGFSLPQDFEQKRIYMIVTKPVSKPFVFLGRYLGYALLLAVFIGSMGLITVGFLRVVKLFSSEKFPALVSYPRVSATRLTAPGGNELETGSAQPGTVPTHAVKSGADRALVWTFEGLRRGRFEDQVRTQSRLIFGAENDPYRTSGSVHVRVRNPGGGAYETDLEMNTNEERDIPFPASLVGDDGRLTVEISARDADGVIAGDASWLVIYERSISYELAFARGLLLILFQSMVVLSMTLAASTCLSAPLSILLGILLYLVGSIYGYIRDGTRDIDQSLAEIHLEKQKSHAHEEDLPPALLLFSSKLSKGVLAVVPDFAAFDFSAWLLKEHSVSWGEIGDAGRKALPPILVLVALGTLIMAFKDFDR